MKDLIETTVFKNSLGKNLINIKIHLSEGTFNHLISIESWKKVVYHTSVMALYFLAFVFIFERQHQD